MRIIYKVFKEYDNGFISLSLEHDTPEEAEEELIEKIAIDDSSLYTILKCYQGV